MWNLWRGELSLDTVLEDFRGQDCAFVANWLRGKGLNKLCGVFQGIFKYRGQLPACCISTGGFFFCRTLCMLHVTRRKSEHSVTWQQRLLPRCTRILFVVNTLTVSQFLLHWMQIIFCIYKDFFRQLKAFPPSFCHFCACEMSPGWGHLITWIWTPVWGIWTAFWPG